MPKLTEWISLQGPMAIDLAGFLWRKYSEREARYTAKRRKYSMAKFAKEIGIDDGTLGAIMNKKGSDKIKFDNLRALRKFFGKEFDDAFDFSAEGPTGWDLTEPVFKE